MFVVKRQCFVQVISQRREAFVDEQEILEHFSQSFHTFLKGQKFLVRDKGLSAFLPQFF